MERERKPSLIRRMADIPEYIGMGVGGSMVLLSIFYPPFLMTGLEVLTLSLTSYAITENISPKR